LQFRSNTWDVFWFEKNYHGDIVAVYSDAGTKLISYKYDAWGGFTTGYHNGGASTKATVNPFRYRGYYYDTHLSLYYLGSRYYDSVVGRFRYSKGNGIAYVIGVHYNASISFYGIYNDIAGYIMERW